MLRALRLSTLIGCCVPPLQTWPALLRALLPALHRLQNGHWRQRTLQCRLKLPAQLRRKLPRMLMRQRKQRVLLRWPSWRLGLQRKPL